MPKGFGWPVLVNRQVRQCPLLARRVLDCDANGSHQTSVRVKGALPVLRVLQGARVHDGERENAGNSGEALERDEGQKIR